MMLSLLNSSWHKDCLLCQILYLEREGKSKENSVSKVYYPVSMYYVGYKNENDQQNADTENDQVFTLKWGKFW